MGDSFTYCWTDHKHNKLYVGVHKGFVDDGYISSSPSFNDEYNKRKQDFTRQIISEGLFEDMLHLESAILRSVDAARNEEFYNKNNSDGKFFCEGHTKETRKKMSNYWKNSDKLNCDHKKANAAWKGSTHTEESKNKMRESAKKYSLSRTLRMQKSNPMKNPESVKKMLESRRRNKEIKNGNSN